MKDEFICCKECGNKTQHCMCEKPRLSDSSPSHGSVNDFIDSLDGKSREERRQAIQERMSQNETGIQALQAENHQLWAVKITI